MSEKTDYNIRHTPERKTVRRSESDSEEESKIMGMQIEGHTTFIFTAKNSNYSESEYTNIIEMIFKNEHYVYSKMPNRKYYKVVDKKQDWSQYDIAVEKDKHIALFVKTNTTESSVERFHTILEKETNESWNVTKNETDMTGSGPNRS